MRPFPVYLLRLMPEHNTTISSKFPWSRLGFPSLVTPSNWGSKSTTAKGSVGGSSTRQKLMGNKSAESLPPTAQSSVKGRRDAMTKQSGKVLLQ